MFYTYSKKKINSFSYMALLALLCNNFKALTSLGDLFLKLVTQTLFERSLAADVADAAAAAAAAADVVVVDDVDDVSVLSPRSLCTNLISKHSITFCFPIKLSFLLCCSYYYSNIEITSTIFNC